MSAVDLAGSMPSGVTFAVVIDGTNVALRVGEQVALVHPKWMTLSQAQIVADALTAIIRQASDE